MTGRHRFGSHGTLFIVVLVLMLLLLLLLILGLTGPDQMQRWLHRPDAPSPTTTRPCTRTWEIRPVEAETGMSQAPRPDHAISEFGRSRILSRSLPLWEWQVRCACWRQLPISPKLCSTGRPQQAHCVSRLCDTMRRNCGTSPDGSYVMC